MIEIPRTAGDLANKERKGYKIRLLGVGGAGLNILSRVAGEGGDSKLMTVLDTDVRALKGSRAAVRLQLGGEVTHGIGCGGDPDLGREAAETSEPQVREMLRGADLVFLCVGLGGGTGSGAAPVIARIAREEGCFVIAAVTLPFHFEGRRRLQQAIDALTDLRDSAGALLTFENDRMEDLIVPSSGVQEAFAAADRMISQSVRAITVLLDCPGMIRVSLDDLLELLNGRDAKCCFGFGEGEGSKRAEKATNEALAQHVKEPNGNLADASSVLIHLAGDNSVTFAEVEQVAEAVAAKTDPSCKVLLGVSASSDLGKKLSVAIISSMDQKRWAGTTPPAEPEGQELHGSGEEPALPPLVQPGITAGSPAEQAPSGSPAPVPERPLVSPESTSPPLAKDAPPAPMPAVAEGGGAPVSAQPTPPPPGPEIPEAPPGAAESGAPPASAPSPLPPPSPKAPVHPPGAVTAQEPSQAGEEQRRPAPSPEPVSTGGGASGNGNAEKIVQMPPSPGSETGTAGMAASGSPAKAAGGAKTGTLGDHLEVPGGKGRFEETEPTLSEGIDLDLPTFLRKRRSARG